MTRGIVWFVAILTVIGAIGDAAARAWLRHDDGDVFAVLTTLLVGGFGIAFLIQSSTLTERFGEPDEATLTNASSPLTFGVLILLSLVPIALLFVLHWQSHGRIDNQGELKGSFVLLCLGGLGMMGAVGCLPGRIVIGRQMVRGVRWYGQVFEIPLEDIEGARYEATTYNGLFTTGGIKLRLQGGAVRSVAFVGEKTTRTSAALVEHLCRNILPRVRAVLESGGQQNFGAVQMDRRSLVIGTKSIPLENVVGYHVQFGIVYFSTSDGRRDLSASYTSLWNAPILFTLIPEYSRAALGTSTSVPA